MAAAAPTLISCPFVADVTRVMPIARIASSEAPLKMLIRFPERTALPKLFVLIETSKKLRSRNTLKMTMRNSANRGIASCDCVSFFTHVRITLVSIIVRTLPRDCVHDGALRQLVTGQLAYNVPVPHNDEPGTGVQHFFNFRRNEGNAHAFRGKLEHELLNFNFRTNIDSPRGFIENQILRIGQQPAREYYLLLVASRKGLDGRIRRRGLYPEQFDVLVRERFSLAPRERPEKSLEHLQGENDVLANREIFYYTVALPVFGK